MEASLVTSFYKLAIAGEQAGFSLESMIFLLNAGLTVENLLGLIEQRLAEQKLTEQKLTEQKLSMPSSSSRWVV